MRGLPICTPQCPRISRVASWIWRISESESTFNRDKFIGSFLRALGAPSEVLEERFILSYVRRKCFGLPGNTAPSHCSTAL